MDLQLSEKVALVTGASSGLGYATAVELLQEGAKVVVCGRSKSRLESAYAEVAKKYSDRLLLVEADLDIASAASELVEKTMVHFNGLDIVVFNSGGPALMHFEEATDAIWEEAFSSLLMSCIRVIRCALPHLRKSAAPSILTVTSITAKQPLPGFLLSNVFRPAVIGLTKTLSKELGEYNIRVNSILPGYTATPRFTEALHYQAQKNHSSFEAEAEKVSEQIPLKRLPDPHEFAKSATFLVSPAASNITGLMMQADGGFYEGLI